MNVKEKELLLKHFNICVDYVRSRVSTLFGFGKERVQLGLNTLSTAQGHLKPIPQKRAKRLRIHLQDQTSP